MKLIKILTLTAITITILAVALYKYLPINRVDVTSELTMLGDLDEDKKWTTSD